MRKLKNILIIAFCIGAIFAFSSCGNDAPKATHTHTYTNEWSKDSTNHWHAATCEHTTEVSGKAAHTFGNWSVKTAATCNTAGVEYRLCSVCGYEETRSTAKTAHTFGDWSVKTVATCDADGVEHRFCSVCNNEETRSIDKIAHTYSSEWSKDATNHWHTATCEHATEIKDSASHTFGDWSVKTAATCDADGVEHRFCAICGYVDFRSIDRISKIDCSSSQLNFQGTINSPFQLLFLGDGISTIDGKINSTNVAKLGVFYYPVFGEDGRVNKFGECYEISISTSDGINVSNKGYIVIPNIKNKATGERYSKEEIVIFESNGLATVTNGTIAGSYYDFSVLSDVAGELKILSQTSQFLNENSSCFVADSTTFSTKNDQETFIKCLRIAMKFNNGTTVDLSGNQEPNNVNDTIKGTYKLTDGTKIGEFVNSLPSGLEAQVKVDATLRIYFYLDGREATNIFPFDIRSNETKGSWNLQFIFNAMPQS